jgi:hypothetical protein
MSEALMLFLLIPVGFGVFALAVPRYSRRKMRRSGTKIEAEIDEVVMVLMPAEPGNTSMHGYYVKYRYRDARGVEHRARSEVLLEDPNAMIVDGKALIAYDADHPDRSAWIGR